MAQDTAVVDTRSTNCPITIFERVIAADRSRGIGAQSLDSPSPSIGFGIGATLAKRSPFDPLLMALDRLTDSYPRSWKEKTEPQDGEEPSKREWA